MEVIQELLPGILVLKSPTFADNRGWLEIPFHRKEFEQATGEDFRVSQTIWSLSARHVIRGLHYQSAAAPVAKIVGCTMGVVYDVMVDLRQESETFGDWIGYQLSPADDHHLYIPAGFAHGYASLSSQSGLFYYQQGYYNPDESRILAWDDPTLGIRWPVQNPILSERDRTQGISWADYLNDPEF